MLARSGLALELLFLPIYGQSWVINILDSQRSAHSTADSSDYNNDGQDYKADKGASGEAAHCLLFLAFLMRLGRYMIL